MSENRIATDRYAFKLARMPFFVSHDGTQSCAVARTGTGYTIDPLPADALCVPFEHYTHAPFWSRQ